MGISSLLFKSMCCMNALGKGKEIHAHHNGLFDEAKALLNRIDSLVFKQNASSWNTLISNYVDYEHGTEALQVFNLMQECSVEPDYITITIRKSFHGLCIKLNLKNVYLQSTLVEIYIEMGNFSAAMKLFNKSSERNIVVWKGLNSGLASFAK
ncbi:Pentatricopeptide repeat-containing protein [Nymphaea thermarum]|nr:Pentatricopeptide repeat-containing protein [Nymphaea thermarum]